MSSRVLDILQQIHSLPTPERDQLQILIADRLERAWDEETRAARAAAVAKGIDVDDDDAIQRLVDEVRYGQSS